MKRTFSRDYWFLLGSWLIFSVLQLVAAVLSGQVQSADAFGRFQDPAAAASFLQEALSILSSACSALSGAALGLIALRYWLSLTCWPIFCFSSGRREPCGRISSVPAASDTSGYTCCPGQSARR